MPPKRKGSANFDSPDTESSYSDAPVHEDESTAPKKRGRKSIIDAILQEEARGTPAPVLPQHQWSVSIVQPQGSIPTTNPTKRRKIQSAAPSLVKQKYPSPGTPSIWGAVSYPSTVTDLLNLMKHARTRQIFTLLSKA
ncbi:hypothetical protein BDM02DRAFT_492433 [Thelephora ganbajun]|uniref:Uncharacterized protein n=1 Tax=Thelephora ganbajun TaxID=370292 RepID=A0ACB6Z7V5_THEGA|nr:hypothetical protein BDM02DRAFT_492433 [Thelephora ganbajun]